MRALEADVVDAVWAATKPLLPDPPGHPLGCHRPRVPDRLCLWALLIRLTTGSSWVDIEAILDIRCRTRRCGHGATSGSQPGCSSSYPLCHTGGCRSERSIC